MEIWPNEVCDSTAPAKPNSLDTNLSMSRSKQTHAPLLSPARIHIHSVKRKNAITFSVNGKRHLLTASRKATISSTLKMKSRGSSNLHIQKAARSSLS